MTSKLYLKRLEEKRIKSGHLWVFSNEIDHIEGNCENGDIVNIFTSNGQFVGSAFYNKNSLISCRVISYQNITSIKELFTHRILTANRLRKLVYPNRSAYRMVFSESDFMPGLIIDRYNKTYVLQISSVGMEKNKELIKDILFSEFNAENVFTKNESGFRNLENLPDEDCVLLGYPKQEIIEEFGIRYIIDFNENQKTGFYFDQTDNRVFIENISNNKTVIDAYCNLGGFGLHALKAGAKSVEFIDSSKNALLSVEHNCKLNSFTAFSLVENGVFEYLQNQINLSNKFDVVMVDPPAFAKNKKSLPQAKQGYEKLNRLALKVTKEDGFLVTSSCSYHLHEEEFLNIINKAASKENVKLQKIKFNNASLDHPSLASMPETTYLKFAVFKILR